VLAKSFHMRVASIILGAWLFTVLPSLAQTVSPPFQNTNGSPLVSIAPSNFVPTSVETNLTETGFSEAEERRAWILALRKFAEIERGMDWLSLLGMLIPAAVTIFVLIFTMNRETRREKARMAQDLELKKLETNCQLEIAKLESGTTYADKVLDSGSSNWSASSRRSTLCCNKVKE
jgi:hypothetical protein